MASFAKEIKNIYGCKTYQDTKNTYDWLTKALQKGGLPQIEIASDFLFYISEISCSCKGVTEFVENAYGQPGYKLVVFHLSVYSEGKQVAFIIVDSRFHINISTNSKVMLERIINLIESTSLDETEINDPISVTYVGTQINNDGVIIHGDGNVVANNQSEVEIEKEKDEPELKKFWSGVLQNITTNFIWYLLTLAAGALAAYLAMR